MKRANVTGDPGDWWAATDGEVLDCLAGAGPVTLDEVCRRLGISEGEATLFLAVLARAGRVRICQVERVA
jgi:hypothetical protein